MSRRRPLLLLLLASAAGALGVLLLRRPRGPWSATGYVGNPTSEVFHRPDCPSYQPTAQSPTFADRGAAEVAGFRPCGICKP